MLTPYGLNNIIVMGLLAVIMLAVGINFIHIKFLSIPLIALSILLLFFTIWFFRDPDRSVPPDAVNDASILVSPADGIVTEIEVEDEPLYLHKESKRISIFLSPLDVHVNRIPISGVVEYYTYNPGKFMIASHPKASEANEQSRIGLSTPFGHILFKQIVGIVARRLVTEIKVGDSVKIGERFGMMKFGSRMDIIVPTDTDVLVKIGDKVVAAETIIAKLKIH
ncbi:MAG: phosphatidylserine decarboxylase family protein [Ignavibacteria bacterium]|jgi:phosphatidylserine decarboxylase|nr:phosphatidylserine decarboxylase family protein [Ignavibacteria bacterium]